MTNTTQEKTPKRGLALRMLDSVERVGNKLPTPAVLFVILFLIVAVLSAIFASLGTSVTYMAMDSKTNQLVKLTVVVKNLLSVDGVQYMLTNVITNFTGFAAMGMVFSVVIFVAIAEGAGLMASSIRKLVSVTPKALITSVVILLGILAHVASSAAYVILVPLSAAVFISFKRHPIAGIAAAFAGCSGGYAANLLIGSQDPMFASISTSAAKILDQAYNVNPASNWYFMIASTFVIVIVGTFITDKIVEPRLGAYRSESSEVEIPTEFERRGLRFAGIACLLYVGIILLAVLPQGAYRVWR